MGNSVLFIHFSNEEDEMIKFAPGNSIGINGLGRIGKLTLWNLILSKEFDKIVVNVGREVGMSFEDLLDYSMNDSTYGSLCRFLFGYKGKDDVQVIDRDKGEVNLFGKKVIFLKKDRNPENIGWGKENVSIVVDTTGKFSDPNDSESKNGTLRGHIAAGARKVILSAPFKFKNKTMPDDSIMLVYGINHQSFDPSRHHIVSAASCTTTALAHLIKPLLDVEETSEILTASMSTIHSMTNSQSVLDSVPSSGAKDLRKNRAAGENIILSTTGAAKALEYILPEMSSIGFMADSVRIPVPTVSLINLNLTFKDPLNKDGFPIITRAFINDIYKEASEGKYLDLIEFSKRQNVSSDLKGKMYAVVVEGHDTHTRTGFIDLPPVSNIPVSHTKIFGWYDNEMGSYVNSLCKLISHVAKTV